MGGKQIDAESTQEDFLMTVIESLGHPFYVIDANDYSVKIANSAASAEPLAEDTTCYALTHGRNTPCESSEHPCPLETVKNTKKPTIVEHLHSDQDGNVRNFEVHACPVLDGDGNVIQMIESCLDITERKRNEEAQLEAERTRVLMETAGAAAHEINQHLSIVIGYCEMLVEDHPGNKRAASICDAALRIHEVVKKMNVAQHYAIRPYLDGASIVDFDAAGKDDRGRG